MDTQFDLFQISETDLRICVPDVCLMESLSWYEGEGKRLNDFDNKLNQLISELRRNVGSLASPSLLNLLQQALIENGNLRDELGFRLAEMHATCAGILSVRSVELIAVTSETATPSYGRVMKEPTDALILSMILQHSHENPDDKKVLLSGNSNDFGTPAVQQLLSESGIANYFSKTDDFLGWFGSRKNK